MTASAIIGHNVEVKGTLDTINTEILTVKEIIIGAVDQRDGGAADVTDTLRDTGGIIVSVHPPIRWKDALYEHPSVGGSRMAISMARYGHGPSPLKAYVYNGGGSSIQTPT
jgi:hypothetical protein